VPNLRHPASQPVQTRQELSHLAFQQFLGHVPRVKETQATFYIGTATSSSSFQGIASCIGVQSTDVKQQPNGMDLSLVH
jgi:hypothetical protein